MRHAYPSNMVPTSFRRTGGLDSDLAELFCGPYASFVTNLSIYTNPSADPSAKNCCFLAKAASQNCHTWRRQATFERRRRLSSTGLTRSRMHLRLHIVRHMISDVRFSQPKMAKTKEWKPLESVFASFSFQLFYKLQQSF